MRRLWSVLAGHRDYRLVLGAGLISLTGDWLLQIGLAYYVYALTGSTVVSGTVLAAGFVPRILLGSLAGVYVDRWEHRTTMIGANLVLAVGLLPLLAVHDASRIWIVYPVVVFETAVEQFFAPAESALVPHIVNADELLTANALNGQNRDIARLVGSALGGVIAAVGGLTWLTLSDIATFVMAAALLAAVRTRRGIAGPTDERSMLREWREGLAVTVRSATLRVLLAVAAIGSVGEGIMGTLFAPFARDVLHGSGAVYGAIVSSQAVGGIVGGLVAAALGPRFSPRSLFGWGSVAFGAIDLALFLYPLVAAPLWPAFTFMVLVGLPAALTTAGLMTVFQASTTDAHRGRVFGAIAAVEALAMLVGTALASWLGTAIGIVPVLSVQGVGYVVGGWIVLRWLPVSPPASAPSRCARSTPPADALPPRQPTSTSGR